MKENKNKAPKDAEGEFHGLCVSYYSNDNLRYRKSYIHGKLHGQSEGYYHRGQLEYRWNWVHGELKGLSESYWPDGTLFIKEYYL